MAATLSRICVLLFCAITSISAATCDNRGPFQTSDAQTLVNQLQTNSIPNNTLASSLPILADHSIRFVSSAANSDTTGPAVCCNNEFLVENTHLALSDIAAGAADIMSQCCTDSGGSCTGGSFIVTGDSGLTVTLLLQDGQNDCEFTSESGAETVVSDLLDVKDGAEKGEEVGEAAENAFNAASTGDALDGFLAFLSGV